MEYRSKRPHPPVCQGRLAKCFQFVNKASRYRARAKAARCKLFNHIDSGVYKRDRPVQSIGMWDIGRATDFRYSSIATLSMHSHSVRRLMVPSREDFKQTLPGYFCFLYKYT
ncbi:hypothetical protein PoB_000981800 [Plakobranchus ocellatus]|uniref:Uncharacterized protein n=1 Tax=Plakobranchus ocellatus TaxID=259542 RepID=A0AAV3YLB5_9GAST|nr:hypothetical protein PoB_000981800 [Plakobranchus ocellatus]